MTGCHKGAGMRDILELCIELDERAEKVYIELSGSCLDPDIATLFSQMAIEEHQHVEWWTQLLDAWDQGLLPDIADEHGMRRRLLEIKDELSETIPDNCAEQAVEHALAIAARFEFYMLDPIFGELLDLMQPGGRVEHRESYSRHVRRLVEAIESHPESGELAGFLARVLRRAYRDQQSLTALATRDQLTGLLNRRGLLGHVNQWLSWSARYRRRAGIALVDIDRFKEINDRYGHAAGDEALVRISAALKSAIRSSDIVGRFGGDEFLIVSPESGEEEVRQLLERVVEMVRATPMQVGDDIVILTVSAGGAWVDGGFDVSPETVIASADRSLYSAKAEGRNRAAAPNRVTAASLN